MTSRFTYTPPPVERVKKPRKWGKRVATFLLTSTLLGVAGGGLVVAFPTQILGGAARMVASGPSPNFDELVRGDMPKVSVMVDSQGEEITSFYNQYREPVSSEDISPLMKQAIVAIEDRRFFEHEGVDWQGLARAAVVNLQDGGFSQGASTLTQQYVKNYTWLVTAQDEQEQAAAIDQNVARKLTEIVTAEDLTQRLSKDEILTRYLNLVTFGNETYGVQAAAQTYFAVNAKDLTLSQAALLAGLVQAPSAFNPYTNPEAALERRNLVLQVMRDTNAIDAHTYTETVQSPLGVLETPNVAANGCISSGDKGFFCAKVIDDLAHMGITREQLAQGGYVVHTTLDTTVHGNAVRALRENANPEEPGVAETMAIVQPGETTREVKSLASSREYGFDAGDTVLPLTTSHVGNGAGSVFKIFTAATAIEKGVSANALLDVPARYEATGLGKGGSENCPQDKYCVTNVGTYPARMTLTDALAQSPNTPFVMLAEKVGNPNVVDMAVRLGMKSYAGASEGQASVADAMRGSGSFTLGVNAVSTLELANVGATLASNGVWCAPATITSVTLPDGSERRPEQHCEKAVEPDVAANVSHALAKDTVNGTAALAARQAGWHGEMAGKTGTTDAHQSASFLGFTQGLSAAVYAFNDGETVRGLCSAPLRQCDSGDVYGGKEPAQTWFSAISPVISQFGGAGLNGQLTENTTAVAEVERLVLGKPENEALQALISAGYVLGNREYLPSNTEKPGNVAGLSFDGDEVKGGKVNLVVSTGPEPQPVREPSQPQVVTLTPEAPPQRTVTLR